jgi:predicted DCC family thiol-disulfide oxidoreductase YuxK
MERYGAYPNIDTSHLQEVPWETFTVAEPEGIILFDGTCAFCEGSVKFIARRDPARYFRFGASQSAQGARLLASHGLTREMTRSMVLIEGGQVFLRSTASLRIAGHLPYPWRLASVFLWVPRPLRDGVYRIVAAIRHRIAGKSNACEIPPPEIRERMI